MVDLIVPQQIVEKEILGVTWITLERIVLSSFPRAISSSSMHHKTAMMVVAKQRLAEKR
jgi:hypothetical protein